MVSVKMNTVILIAVALIVIAIVLPIGLVYIGNAGNTAVTLANGSKINPATNNSWTLTDAVDPAIITLLTILLPILVVIGVIMYFIPRNN